MSKIQFIVSLLCLALLSCAPSSQGESIVSDCQSHASKIKGGLLLTHFPSFDSLQKALQFTYEKSDAEPNLFTKPTVRLTHCSDGKAIESILHTGVSERDFEKARDGGFWERLQFGFRSPYSVFLRDDLLRVAILARRRWIFWGEGDIAFYDLAKTMVDHINEQDRRKMSEKDLGEKGYLNTFNHMTAQAFMTSLFSEEFADFLADAHERRHIPELITGKFTEEQRANVDFGAVDNYVDIINNEWGQELGKRLSAQSSIDRHTVWTPELLAAYLNEIQNYYSWAFQLGFRPFSPKDEIVLRFSDKLNHVMHDLESLK